MVSQHTLHHSKNKWNQASSEQKAVSKLSRKINIWEKKYKKLLLRHNARLNQVRLLAEACNKLVKEGVVKREFFSPYMPKFKDVIETLKKGVTKRPIKNSNSTSLPTEA